MGGRQRTSIFFDTQKPKEVQKKTKPRKGKGRK